MLMLGIGLKSNKDTEVGQENLLTAGSSVLHLSEEEQKDI
jgi:hypothetical protein